MLNVEGFIQDKYPALYQRHPRLAPWLTRFLRLIFREKAFHQFEQDYPWLRGFDFVEQVLEYFDFHYTVRDDERTRIPESGRVVIIANHPIGSLDGLALLKLVREARTDVSTADGVQFAGFNIDPDFSNCVDGLIVVDLERLQPKRRRRYFEQGLVEVAA